MTYHGFLLNSALLLISAWTDDDLIAQAILFFLAGFETVSAAMSFLLHELAMNPDVQEKLVQEIRENDEKNGGKFDYNSIQNMTYMDMVVSGKFNTFNDISSTRDVVDTLLDLHKKTFFVICFGSFKVIYLRWYKWVIFRETGKNIDQNQKNKS